MANYVRFPTDLIALAERVKRIVEEDPGVLDVLEQLVVEAERTRLAEDKQSASTPDEPNAS